MEIRADHDGWTIITDSRDEHRVERSGHALAASFDYVDKSGSLSTRDYVEITPLPGEPDG